MRPNLVLILGAGESGVGAAILAKHLGYEVFISEAKQMAPNYLADVQTWGLDFEQGGHDLALAKADAQTWVIKSPGIPPWAEVVQTLKGRGCVLMDELNFAALHNKTADLLVITGSNGKTTTTRLLHHLLESSGLAVGLAGNVGYSLARQIALGPEKQAYVVEASSFQLENCPDLKPKIALLLNLSPDHLDRYAYKMEAYAAAKFELLRHLGPSDTLIYGQDGPYMEAALARHGLPACQSYPLSLAQFDPQQAELTIPHLDWHFEAESLPLQGRHNRFNMAAAILAAAAYGLDFARIKTALPSFQNEDHRLQKIVSIEGVDYYNDSKATNVEAVYFALEAMQQPLVWIAGGQDKGNDYTQLYPLVQQKVKAIICLGLNNRPLFEAFQHIQPIMLEAQSMGEAIKLASLYAEAGDAVLLSPACASFDLFQNYRDRGQQFQRLLLQQAGLLRDENQSRMISMSFEINLNQAPSQANTDHNNLSHSETET